jgi:protein O-mannosyl-transferase
MRRLIGSSWFPITCIAVATFALYVHSLRNGFVVWDDDILVYKNPLVLHFSPYAVWAAFTSYDPELYIPLTLLSYQIEHLLFGLNPTVFHTTNLLLHIGSATCVFSLLQRWKIARPLAFLAALVFAIHPVNSEAVAWVSARKDTLSSFLFLVALLQWERYKSHHLRRTYAATVVVFFLALLAKVSVVLLPFVMLLLDWRDGRRFDRRALAEKLPFFLLAAIFTTIALFGKTGNIAALTPWETFLLAAKGIAFYVQIMLFPFGLSSIYHQSTPVSIAAAEFAVPVIAVVLCGIGVLLSVRQARTVAFSALFFLLLLVPAFANFSKLGGVYYASDRYIYLAQIGILYLLGWGYTLLMRTRLARTGMITTSSILTVLLPTFAWASYERGKLWGDSETLFRDAMERNPGSAVIHFNLAVVEQERGDYEEAMALYQKTLLIRPDYSQVYNNGGLMYRERGDQATAEEWFRTAVALDSGNLSAYINLATILIDRGDADGAITLLMHAVDLDPHNAQAYIKLGAAYGKKGMYAEGLRAFQRAWELDPATRKKAQELETLMRELER